MPAPEVIPPIQWGKDHWSLLGYLAARFDGVIDRKHMRANPTRHPLLCLNYGVSWKDAYSTRLKEGVASGHDDWDCIDDLAAAGFIEIVSMINGFFRLTAEGNRVAFLLRQHKAEGGTFAGFAEQYRLQQNSGVNEGPFPHTGS